ncbi:MAG: hypothetical protein GY765_22210 [bacterium]|nr:hypothetical protein [bacterium]
MRDGVCDGGCCDEVTVKDLLKVGDKYFCKECNEGAHILTKNALRLVKEKCKGLEKERDALKEALQAIADRIPPHSVYQAFRHTCGVIYYGYPTDEESIEKIADQEVSVLREELNEGLQWMIDHNPQEEGHIK